MSDSTSGRTKPVKNHLKVSTFYTIQVDNLSVVVAAADDDDDDDDDDNDQVQFKKHYKT